MRKLWRLREGASRKPSLRCRSAKVKAPFETKRPRSAHGTTCDPRAIGRTGAPERTECSHSVPVHADQRCQDAEATCPPRARSRGQAREIMVTLEHRIGLPTCIVTAQHTCMGSLLSSRSSTQRLGLKTLPRRARSTNSTARSRGRQAEAFSTIGLKRGVHRIKRQRNSYGVQQQSAATASPGIDLRNPCLSV